MIPISASSMCAIKPNIISAISPARWRSGARTWKTKKARACMATQAQMEGLLGRLGVGGKDTLILYVRSI